MSRMIFVSPMPGHRILNPFNNHAELPKGGLLVPDDAYWRRRKDEGGVSIVDATSAAPPTPAEVDQPAPAKRASKS